MHPIISYHLAQANIGDLRRRAQCVTLAPAARWARQDALRTPMASVDCQRFDLPGTAYKPTGTSWPGTRPGSVTARSTCSRYRIWSPGCPRSAASGLTRERA